mmetsp:Transcript_98154/g.194377  ORF Transcript_98154/g.194377 Transcript_98154/m.194377 type:complete len:96 (-) Transcript_98154:110-397(-)
MVLRIYLGHSFLTMAMLVLGMNGSTAVAPTNDAFVPCKDAKTRGSSMTQLYAEITTAAERANRSKQDRKVFMDEFIVCSEGGLDCEMDHDIVSLR